MSLPGVQLVDTITGDEHSVIKNCLAQSQKENSPTVISFLVCNSCCSYIFNVLIWKARWHFVLNTQCCSAKEHICSCSCTIWAGEQQGCPRVPCPALQSLARIPQVLELLHCHPHGLCWTHILGGSSTARTLLSAQKEQQQQAVVW